MASEQHRINMSYSLAKDKKQADKWVVCSWVNDALYANDGSNRRMCRKGDMTRWKYFQEVMEYLSEEKLIVGDRVRVEQKVGVDEFYYVINQITTSDGTFKYFIGI